MDWKFWDFATFDIKYIFKQVSVGCYADELAFLNEIDIDHIPILSCTTCLTMRQNKKLLEGEI